MKTYEDIHQLHWKTYSRPITYKEYTLKYLYFYAFLLLGALLLIGFYAFFVSSETEVIFGITIVFFVGMIVGNSVSYFTNVQPTSPQDIHITYEGILINEYLYSWKRLAEATVSKQGKYIQMKTPQDRLKLYLDPAVETEKVLHNIRWYLKELSADK